MSRTYKDEPFWIREFRNDPRYGYVPDDWRDRTDFRKMPRRPNGFWEEWDEWWNSLPNASRMRGYTSYVDSTPGFSAFRKDLNRSYRRTAKLKVKAGKYDEIPRPRRNARWLWW